MRVTIGNLKPIGFQKLSVSSTAVALTIPTTEDGITARTAVIVVEDDAVRWRDDGVDPSASVGMLASSGSSFIYDAKLGEIRFIRVTGDAVVDIAYYA